MNIRGTLGQPVLRIISASGRAGDVTLGQGFWHGGAVYRTYLPLVVRN